MQSPIKNFFKKRSIDELDEIRAQLAYFKTIFREDLLREQLRWSFQPELYTTDFYEKRRMLEIINQL